MSDGRTGMSAFMACTAVTITRGAPSLRPTAEIIKPSDIRLTYVQRPPVALGLKSILCPTAVFKPSNIRLSSRGKKNPIFCSFLTFTKIHRFYIQPHIHIHNYIHKH
jgi:hypothetical protein